MNNLTERFFAHHNQILFIEIAGLLHDIGKLSKKFLEYRQTWQDEINGWENDPHKNQFLDNDKKYNDTIFNDSIKHAFEREIGEIGRNDFKEDDFSIKKAVHNHHKKPGENDLIMQMLKAADRLDSAIDRNYPLWQAEQKEQKGTIFQSNVFGYEKDRLMDFDGQDEARERLYGFLDKNLPNYFSEFSYDLRIEILNEIKIAFEQGLSDTNRPQNDTTLWEHAYSVASILKAITAHYLLCGEKLVKIYNRSEENNVKFGILGIGWDGLGILSYGHKIGDIVGRKQIIEKIKNRLIKLIEYDFPLGNTVYKDDDGIYFITPACIYTEDLKDLMETLRRKIYENTRKESSGEIQPHIVEIPETTTLTSLVKAIKDMKIKTGYRFDGSVEGFTLYKESLLNFEKEGEEEKKKKKKKGKTICPVCRIRPVEREDVLKKVCKVCKKRRVHEIKKKETPFVDEIIDDNKRAALIVTRFNLDKWMKGRMIRNMFVTEPKGIEREIDNLRNVEDFKTQESIIKENYFDQIKEKRYTYERIKLDIESFDKDDPESVNRAKHTAFLYDRRHNLEIDKIDPAEIAKVWKDKLDWISKELEGIEKSIPPFVTLCNILCAKTPTPSTLMDVWNTTREFFEEISTNLFKSVLTEKNRLGLLVRPLGDRDIDLTGKGTVEAEVPERNKSIEFIQYKKDTIEIIGETFPETSPPEWEGKRIRITDKEFLDIPDKIFIIEGCITGTTYIPCRTITVSPNIFMAIVPANKTLEITDHMYQRYIEHFGKVMGRLPFSIGNIFFGNKMPMFVVLDAGKRMVANFDNLGRINKKFRIKKEAGEDTLHFGLKYETEGTEKSLTWELPYKLGNGKVDYHHPYFILDSEKKDTILDRSGFFKTISDDMINFSKMSREGYENIKIYPNYYDFEFIDSNKRRHDIFLDPNTRRKSAVTDFRSKPFLLDDLKQKIMYLWTYYIQGKRLKGITDTKLRNLQSLWLTKYQEWIKGEGPGNLDAWKALITTSIKKEFSIDIEKTENILLNEINSDGLFFDILELYLVILKEKVDTKENVDTKI